LEHDGLVLQCPVKCRARRLSGHKKSYPAIHWNNRQPHHLNCGQTHFMCWPPAQEDLHFPAPLEGHSGIQDIGLVQHFMCVGPVLRHIEQALLLRWGLQSASSKTTLNSHSDEQWTLYAHLDHRGLDHKGGDWDCAPSRLHELGEWPDLVQAMETSLSLPEGTEKSSPRGYATVALWPFTAMTEPCCPSPLPSSHHSPSSVSSVFIC